MVAMSPLLAVAVTLLFFTQIALAEVATVPSSQANATTPHLTELIPEQNGTDAALTTRQVRDAVTTIKTGTEASVERVANVGKDVRQTLANVFNKHGKKIAVGAVAVAAGAAVAVGGAKYHHAQKVKRAVEEVKAEAARVAEQSAAAADRWDWLQKRTALRAISAHDAALRAAEKDAETGQTSDEAIYWSIQDAEARALADAFAGDVPRPVNIAAVEKRAREERMDELIRLQQEKQATAQAKPLDEHQQDRQESARAELLAAIESMTMVDADETNALTDDDKLLATALEAAILHDFPDVHDDGVPNMKARELHRAVLSGVEQSEESTRALFAFVDALNAFEAAEKEAELLRQKAAEETPIALHNEPEAVLQETYRNVAREAATVAHIKQTRRELQAVRDWMSANTAQDPPLSSRTWASTVSNPFSDKYEVTQDWCDEQVASSGKTPSACRVWYKEDDEENQYMPHTEEYSTSDALTTWLRGSLASSESAHPSLKKHSYHAVRL